MQAVVGAACHILAVRAREARVTPALPVQATAALHTVGVAAVGFARQRLVA